jgi:hypothetical protein
MRHTPEKRLTREQITQTKTWVWFELDIIKPRMINGKVHIVLNYSMWNYLEFSVNTFNRVYPSAFIFVKY